MKTKTYKGIGGTCGVMPYVMEGRSTSVFLSPEELFKSASKLVNIPVVIKKHVTAEQANKSKVGVVTSAYPLDNFSIGVDLQIWDEEAIKYIDSGNVELSAGYTAKLSKGDDHWYGSSYSYTKEIDTFDHIVVLPQGDARNRIAKIFLNNNNAEITGNVETSFEFNIVNSSCTTSTTSTTTMNLKSIVLPANQRSVEVDPDVAAYIETLKSNVSSLQTKLNDSNTTTTQEVEALNTRLTDSKALLERTISEKDQTIADQKAKLPKYLEIANKASRLGVAIDYAAFDPIDVMRRSLVDFPEIDKQSEETITYLFSTLKEPEVTSGDVQVNVAKERQTVGDNNTADLKGKVESTVVTLPTGGISAKNMSDNLAEKRRNAGKVTTIRTA